RAATARYTLSLHDALPIFNERLEHHGLESVETDLGEYIIQLAHQRPYHIVAPALHMTRYDVAEIFTRRLNVLNEVVIEKQTAIRSEEHTSELQSRVDLVCR